MLSLAPEADKRPLPSTAKLATGSAWPRMMVLACTASELPRYSSVLRWCTLDTSQMHTCLSCDDDMSFDEPWSSESLSTLLSWPFQRLSTNPVLPSSKLIHPLPPPTPIQLHATSESATALALSPALALTLVLVVAGNCERAHRTCLCPPLENRIANSVINETTSNTLA